MNSLKRLWILLLFIMVIGLNCKGYCESMKIDSTIIVKEKTLYTLLVQNKRYEEYIIQANSTIILADSIINKQNEIIGNYVQQTEVLKQNFKRVSTEKEIQKRQFEIDKQNLQLENAAIALQSKSSFSKGLIIGTLGTTILGTVIKLFIVK